MKNIFIFYCLLCLPFLLQADQRRDSLRNVIQKSDPKFAFTVDQYIDAALSEARLTVDSLNAQLTLMCNEKVMELQKQAIETENIFLSKYDLVLTVFGLIVAIFFGINFYSAYKSRQEIAENIKRERDLIENNNSVLRIHQEFKDGKNEFMDVLREFKTSMEEELKESKVAVDSLVEDLQNEHQEINFESRTAFRNLNKDVLNILDNLIEDSHNKALYVEDRSQIMEYHKILDIYNDDLNIVKRALHTLFAHGTGVCLEHLNYLKKKYIRKMSTSTDDTIIEAYKGTNKLINKVIIEIKKRDQYEMDTSV